MGAAHGSNTHGGDSKYGSISAIHIAKWHGHICFTCALQAHLTYVSLDQVWYYKEQAARGNSAAILNLAVCHLSGVGMLRNSAAGAGVRARACVFARVCFTQSGGNPVELRCRCGVDEGRGIAWQRHGGAQKLTRSEVSVIALSFCSLCVCILCRRTL